MQNSESPRNQWNWHILSLKPRVDSFNFSALQEEISGYLGNGGQHLALEMRTNRFMSMAAINYLISIAKNLADSGGALALISPSDRALKHFEIYAAERPFVMVRSKDQLPHVRASIVRRFGSEASI